VNSSETPTSQPSTLGKVLRAFLRLILTVTLPGQPTGTPTPYFNIFLTPTRPYTMTLTAVYSPYTATPRPHSPTSVPLPSTT